MATSSNEEKSKSDKKILTEEELLVATSDELNWSFFQKNDIQAAYLVGLFFRLVDYDQISVLNTRGLRKKMRYLFNDPDKTKIEKIFQSCIETQIAVMDKIRSKTMKYSKIRSTAEEKMATATWNSPSEQLSIGFMSGYDLYWKIFNKKYPNENNISNEGDNEE